MQVIPRVYLIPYYIIDEMVVATENGIARPIAELDRKYDEFISQIEERSQNVEYLFGEVRDQCRDYNRHRKEDTKRAISIVARRMFDRIPLPNLYREPLDHKKKINTKRKWQPLTFLD